MKYLNYNIIILFCTLLTMACNTKNTSKDINNLNGYWEITEVTLNNGTKKQYKVNETIDYFFIDNQLKGFRKKLTPKLEGGFYGSKQTESIAVLKKSNLWHIEYSTPYNQWQETIIQLDSNTLKLKNSKKDIYIYKRFKPLNSY